MSERKRLTKAQAGKLGGLTAAERMTPEARRERARKAGEACLVKHGRSHYYRMALGLATKPDA